VGLYRDRNLLNMIEEEFGVQLDLEMLAEFDSFARIEAAVGSELAKS